MLVFFKNVNTEAKKNDINITKTYSVLAFLKAEDFHKF